MSIDWHDKKFQVPDVSFKERLKHQSWCFKNDITINLIEYQWNKYFIRINDKGKIIDHCDEQGNLIYYKQTKLKINDKIWSKQVWLLYTEYYLKYNKNE